jgi:cobalamin synthase
MLRAASQQVRHGGAIFGGVLLLLGVAYLYAGKSYERGGGWVERSKEPEKYWWSIALYFATGIFAIAVDLLDAPWDIVLGLLIVFVGVYFVYLLLMWLTRKKE